MQDNGKCEDGQHPSAKSNATNTKSQTYTALSVDMSEHSEGAMSAEQLWKGEEIADAMYCFRTLLLFNVTLESFSHGANDTGMTDNKYCRGICTKIFFHP